MNKTTTKNLNFMGTKYLFAICVVVAAFGIWRFNQHCEISASENSTLEMNAEALASGENSVVNTGPGKYVKCEGGAGHRKLCMCENIHPCTESECK